MAKENFFNKAKADGQVFVRTIGLVTKLGKLKLEIRGKQRDQEKLYKLVGAATYEVHLLDEIPYDRFYIDSVLDHLEKLIELDHDIVDLQEQMEQARRDFRGELEPKKITDQQSQSQPQQDGQQDYPQQRQTAQGYQQQQGQQPFQGQQPQGQQPQGQQPPQGPLPTQGQQATQYSGYMQPTQSSQSAPPMPQGYQGQTPPMPQAYDQQQQQGNQPPQGNPQPPQSYTPTGQPQKSQSSNLMDQMQQSQGSPPAPSKKKKKGDKPLSRSGDSDDEE